jgi:predicted nucleic acid-binding protein
VKYLLDSVIVIDHLNGRDEATEFIARYEEQSAISVVTRAEVLSGIEGAPSEITVLLLKHFDTLPIDKTVADLAASLRRKYRWRLPDAFQAALAELHGLKLVTRNTKDFPPGKHGFVLVPYR